MPADTTILNVNICRAAAEPVSLKPVSVRDMKSSLVEEEKIHGRRPDRKRRSQQRTIWFRAATIKFEWSSVFTVVGALWGWTVTSHRMNNVFLFYVSPWDSWRPDWKQKKRRDEEKERTEKRSVCGRKKFKFLYVFYQWRLGAPSAPPPPIFPLVPLKTVFSFHPRLFLSNVSLP